MTVPTLRPPPAHPFVGWLGKEAVKYLDEHFRPYVQVATAVIAHRREHGTDPEGSVYRIDGPGKQDWEYLGPKSDPRNLTHLLLDGIPNRYVRVQDTTGVNDIASRVCPPGAPEYVRGRRLDTVREKAAPIISVTLATCVHNGALNWETDETIRSAGQRLALDAAWQIVSTPLDSVRPRAIDVYSTFIDVVGLPKYGDAAGIARPEAYLRAYLDTRGGIADTLERKSIGWGGQPMRSNHVAMHLGIDIGTWRSYLSREEAPGPDLENPSMWWMETIEAWHLLRPRIDHPDW